MNISALYQYSQADHTSRLSVSNNLLIVSALEMLIVQHLMHASRSFVLSVSTSKRESSNFFKQLVQRFSNDIDVMAFQLVWQENLQSVTVQGPRMHNLVLVDSFEAFIALNPFKVTRQYNFNEYFYIVLHSSVYREQNMLSIFKYCWRYHIINCNVQIQVPSEPRLLLYTYTPFARNQCGRVVPMLINVFEGKNWTKPIIFPQKLKDMQGCPLRVATWNIAPYIQIKKAHNGSVTVDGYEGNLLNCLAELMNFKIQLIEMNEQSDEIHTLSLDDYKRWGFDKLVSGEADLSIGYIRDNPWHNEMVSALFPHSQVPLVLSVLRNGQPYTRMAVLAFPFSKLIWTLLIIAIVAHHLLVKMVYREHKMRANLGLTFIMGMALGIPTKFIPKPTHHRFVYMAWILFSFIWRNIYCAILFNLFCTNFYREPPHSIAQLVAEKYVVVCNRDIYTSISSFLQEYPFHVEILDEFDEAAALNYLALHPELKAAAITSTPMIAVQPNPNRFFIIPGTVINIQLAIYVRKHSFLIDHMNTEMPWIISTGYMRRWINNNVIHKYSWQFGQNLEVRLIKHKDLYFIFILLIFKLILAIFIFILELMWCRIQKVYRKIKKYC